MNNASSPNFPPRPEPDDLLQQAQAALRARGQDAAPPAAVLERARLALQAPAVPLKLKQGIWTMKRIFGTSLIGGLAAAIVLVVALGLFPRDRSAFAQVLDNVRQVQTVKMKIRNVMQMGGQSITVDGIMYISEPSRQMRQEFHLPEGDVINVFDMKEGKGLSLAPAAKTATRLDLSHIPGASVTQDFLASLQKMSATGARELGAKEIDGRPVHGYFATETDNDTVTETTLWADDQTKMPLLVERTVRNGFLPMQLTLSDFQWNVALDPALLKMDIPEGYLVKDAAMDMGKPTEADVAAALKASVFFNNGRFPLGLTTRQLGQSMYLALPDQDKPQIELKMQEQSGNILVIAHGWAFISDPKNGAGWRWAGTDVPLGQKGRPVLWYKPAGKDTYTVFDADLTIHTETREPSVPSLQVDTATQPAN